MRQPPLPRLLLASACTAILFANPLANAAQSAAPQSTSVPIKPLVYDVITIKPNKTGSGSSGSDSRDDHYHAGNVSLKTLLQQVSGIQEDQISGIPGPIDSARFDIDAKVVDFDADVLKKMTSEQRRVMLLPLLSERFQLKTHIETKILPVYELVVLKGGPKFKPSADQTKHGGGSTSISNTALKAHDLPMVSFAKTLAGQIHRPVIDKTGLPGNFDLTVTWSSDEHPDTDAPSIFTAIQEQLGLKLVPAKGPVDTLVVDHVEMPTEN
jgi:uncharacterized protein (TIGR03435 family)